LILITPHYFSHADDILPMPPAKASADADFRMPLSPPPFCRQRVFQPSIFRLFFASPRLRRGMFFAGFIFMRFSEAF
jgi:hypothetical protein